MTHHPAVVVGAGPTGMVAASLLGRHGIECLVLDRWEDIFPQPRAVHLDDEVHRILGDLGVAEAFTEISRPGRGLRLVDPAMDTIAEFERDPDSRPHGFPPANMFDQPELERILRSAMTRNPHVQFRGGVEITDVATMRDHVQVIVREVATGERSAVTADVVLGCDGANSAVRAALGTTMRTLAPEQRWLVVDASSPVDPGLWDGVHQLCDPHRAGTFMRIGQTRYRWEFELLEHETVDDFPDLDALASLLDPWLRRAPRTDLELVRVTEYTFRAQLADRWRDRRVFLLGDAAHLTPPFIGQGMGAGLRDAYNLTWKVAGVLGGSLPEAALDSYEQERVPHARAMIRQAVAVGWAMNGGGERVAGLRRRVFPVVTRVPGLSSVVTDSATPRLHPSMFVRRGSMSPRRLEGTLCPNAPTERGVRFDAVAPYRFTVVTTVKPEPAQRQEIARRGAEVLLVSPGSDHGRWLRRGRVSAALVRPDRTVMATARSLSALHTLVPPSPSPLPPNTIGRADES
ncbi:MULTISPECIES: bifunctional 3-(3-hydroxy-phenyl)propionate/3-hydroxycinnamic acid hydroxylase MhpA [unclassified Rhodococcus (in: high G+C Gram-positive bacteria)]|uniref:bifunctional 3-(3-hydroxy-phenyl)propionate/3-hydroxycinnamic acid hydroxylase MhpA n=1 Tax=unclassified Rhodococcus (in: high G+C Gram-positive bacteria) TaxID=192944 RepID=UPI0004891361|nr:MULTISPECIES: bifunctional 3-(3-hydroxy-phenyl)propionate/3-hydroxycinnamic acid hydroxylase [unclassified Rhodococcus (in: high G+C Gram-positive bacteria)]MDQ1203007.1 3-(3-hydroxy-phenyl)propionate hydroxylase [Rhodococcus sp. SORGH_AS_0303]